MNQGTDIIYSQEHVKNSRQIAEGTTAYIYEAKLHGLTVAIKTLKEPQYIQEPSTRERARNDFENELRVNALLRHPNILQFIGCVDKNNNVKSLVFELAKAGSLKCSKFGLRRLNKGLLICVGVAEALRYAHSMGIIHRDVKPSQVLMIDNVPKLGDWGFATFTESEGCFTGETGTWEFMAPEVIRYEKYGSAADVYSFGVLLYCVVSGKDYPYMDQYLTPSQAATGVARKSLRPSMPSQIPKSVSHIITSCWASDANARPSMVEVVAMLRNAEKSVGVNSPKTAASWASWIW